MTKKSIDKNAMGLGYIEMGGINLAISQENYHLETEGARLGYDKMDTAETEGNAQ